MANPKVQIIAINKKKEWLRIEGSVSLCEDQTAANEFLQNSPFLRDRYKEMDMQLMLFQIDSATVERRTRELQMARQSFSLHSFPHIRQDIRTKHRKPPLTISISCGIVIM